MSRDIEVRWNVENEMKGRIRLTDDEWAEFIEWTDDPESTSSLAEFLRSYREGDTWWQDRLVDQWTSEEGFPQWLKVAPPLSVPPTAQETEKP